MNSKADSRCPLAGFGSIAVIAILLSAPVSYASTPQTPTTLTGATVVSAEQASRLLAQGARLIDARVAHEYAEEHIRGAVNVPYKEKSAKRVDYDARLDSFDLNRLPPDKRQPVVFYCNAGECWKSYKACRAAVTAGYSRVYWLRGGIPEWKAKGLPVN